MEKFLDDNLHIYINTVIIVPKGNNNNYYDKLLTEKQ